MYGLGMGGLQGAPQEGSLEKISLGKRWRKPLGEREGESPGGSEAPGRATHCEEDHAAQESGGTGGPHPAPGARIGEGAPALGGLGTGVRVKAKEKEGRARGLSYEKTR